MEGLRRFIGSLLIIAGIPTLAFTEEPWIGKEVFWVDGAIARVGDQTIDIETIPLTTVVEAEDGDSVRLGTAWVRKTDLMLPVDAPNYFSEKILNHPNSAIYRKKLGLAWQLLKEFDKAVSDYTEAIRLDPQDSYTYEFRSRAWFVKRETERALDDISEAIRLGPPRPMIFDSRGAVWLVKRDADRADIWR